MDRSVGVAFGGAIRELRTQRGLSQELLAHSSGLHRTYVSMLERGERTPSLSTVFQLANALRISPGRLVQITQLTLEKIDNRIRL